MTGLTTTGAMTAVLQQAVAGDEAAFARIVAAYHADMLRVAYGICGNPDLALDAVQAAWLIAWRKLRSLREPERLRSWLVAVPRTRPGTSCAAGVRDVSSEILVDPPDPVPRPTRPTEIRRRLDLLPSPSPGSRADERSLIALRYGAELDSSEIAPLLGLSPSGVRGRLTRVMGRLRKELDDG